MMWAKLPIYFFLVATLCQPFTGAFPSTFGSASKAELEPRQSTSVTASVQALATFSQQWSAVPDAFSACQSTFSQQVSVEVAVKAVVTLRQQLEPVIRDYSSCSCGGAVSTQSQYVSQFRSSITQTYKTWQDILQTGQKFYAAEWQSQFAARFKGFSDFVQATKSACSSVNISLDGLLSGIRLNLNVFLGVKINLGGLIGGLLGGLLGGGLKERELISS